MSASLEIQLLNDKAYIPQKAHKSDAGWDLRTYVDFKIPPNDRLSIGIGIAIHLPKNTYGRVASKSGLALNHGILIGGGVIDEGYTGEICIIIINFNTDYFECKKGDKIAQLIVEKIEPCEIKIVDILSETDDDRGSDGFGSTGK